jgi:hypothetical protein
MQGLDLRIPLILTRLVLASLGLAAGIDRAASAAEECGNRYKICNVACDRPADPVTGVFACKSGCDFRLIACDREPVNAYAPGENHRALRGAPSKVIDAPARQHEAR